MKSLIAVGISIIIEASSLGKNQVLKIIVKSIIEKVSYIRPIAGSVGIALDIKEVAENFILIGVLRTVGFRFIKECTQHKLYYIGKCIWFVEGFITSIFRTGTSLKRFLNRHTDYCTFQLECGKIANKNH